MFKILSECKLKITPMKHSYHLFHFGSFHHGMHTHICAYTHAHDHQRVTLQQLSFGLEPESQLAADIKTGEEQDQKIRKVAAWLEA